MNSKNMNKQWVPIPGPCIAKVSSLYFKLNRTHSRRVLKAKIQKVSKIVYSRDVTCKTKGSHFQPAMATFLASGINLPLEKDDHNKDYPYRRVRSIYKPLFKNYESRNFIQFIIHLLTLKA